MKHPLPIDDRDVVHPFPKQNAASVTGNLKKLCGYGSVPEKGSALAASTGE